MFGRMFQPAMFNPRYLIQNLKDLKLQEIMPCVTPLLLPEYWLPKINPQIRYLVTIPIQVRSNQMSLTQRFRVVQGNLNAIQAYIYLKILAEICIQHM